MKRILSGVQPSGNLHIGNYFGAIRQHIALQDEAECFYFIADYHAFTTLPDVESDPAKRAAVLKARVFDAAVSYLALGLDSEKVAFYRQSDIPEVTELAWLFATVTGMGLLERATSYKDKIAKGLTPNVGLFTYPILMAADILIVRSDIVPVGKDQIQHVEMTCDMAGYFNQTYKPVFPLPTFRLDKVPLVPGTDGQKMSKTYGNSIDIFAEGKTLKKQVMGVVTDSTPVDAPKDPAKCNVFALYKLFATPEEEAKLADLYANPLRDADARQGRPFGYGDAKGMLLAKIDAYFAPARAKRKELEAHPEKVEALLRRGAEKARVETRKTMAMVREAVGLGAYW